MDTADKVAVGLFLLTGITWLADWLFGEDIKKVSRHARIYVFLVGCLFALAGLSSLWLWPSGRSTDTPQPTGGAVAERTYMTGPDGKELTPAQLNALCPEGTAVCITMRNHSALNGARVCGQAKRAYGIVSSDSVATGLEDYPQGCIDGPAPSKPIQQHYPELSPGKLAAKPISAKDDPCPPPSGKGAYISGITIIGDPESTEKQDGIFLSGGPGAVQTCNVSILGLSGSAITAPKGSTVDMTTTNLSTGLYGVDIHETPPSQVQPKNAAKNP